MGKRVRDILTEWPPTGWGGWYSGNDDLSPDISKATIKEAKENRGDITLTVQLGNRELTTTVHVPESANLDSVLKALITAKGQLIEDAGDIEI